MTTNDYRAFERPGGSLGELSQSACLRFEALTAFATRAQGQSEVQDDELLYWLSDPSVAQTITAQHVILRPARMGLRLFVAPEIRLPSLTTVWIPESVEDLPIRQALLSEANLEIGGGLGAVKGRIWRLGLMGETSSPANVLNTLSWLERLLKRAGAKVGSGLEAAQAALV